LSTASIYTSSSIGPLAAATDNFPSTEQHNQRHAKSQDGE
jgi:hypothetical protein